MNDPKTASASMGIENLYLPYNHLFSAASKRAFQNEVKQHIVERELKVITTTALKVIDEVRYFGARATGERKIFDAAQKVANTVNFYASKRFVTGALLKLALIQLATEPHELEEFVVVSYVALSPEGLEYLRANPTKVEFVIDAVNVDEL